MLIDINSIKTRLMLVLAAVLAAVLVLGMIFLRPVMKRHYVGMARTAMTETAVRISHSLDFYLTRATAELQSVAAMSEIASFDQTTINRVLLDRSHTNTYFTRMCVVDNYGKFVASPTLPFVPGSSVPEGRMPYIREASRGASPVYMNILGTTYGTLSSGIAVPIQDRSGANRGVLMGIIEATDKNFMMTLLGDLGLDKDASAYIVGTDGRLLAHSSFQLRPDRLSEYNLDALKPVSAALDGHTGFVEFTDDGGDYYAAYAPVKSSGWAVVVQQSTRTIVDKSNRTLLIAASALAGAFLVIAFFQGLMINIALRPLTLLAESLRKKTALPVGLLSEQRGEIASLSREITSLIENIKHRDELLEQINQELDGRVQERTRELKDTNTRLSGEIAERKLTEERLRDARRRFEDVACNTGDWIWEIDEKGMFVFSSGGIERIIGARAEEMIGRSFQEVFVPNASQDMQKAVLDEFFGKRPFKNVVRSVTGRDGRTRLIETSGVPIFDSSGEFRGYRGSARDVTDRMLMDAKVKESLKEKEVLLKEIHHRVKNNMQVISSMLNLQSRYVTDTDAQGLFQESQNRLKAMALVHEKLYQSENLSQVNFTDYIRNLTSHLQKSMGGGRISLDVLIDSDMQLDIDTIIPCGLILNELVSNAMKHAFKGKEYGKVTVMVQKAEGEYFIRVCDDGLGLPKGFSMDEGSSLGTKLISALVAQIDGTIVAESQGQGACFTLRFPTTALNTAAIINKAES